MCVGFLGFATHGTMQSVLNQLQAARFFGHRISVRVSRDSQPCAAAPKAQPKALMRSVGTQTAGPMVATMATQTESPPAEEEKELYPSPSPPGPLAPATKAEGEEGSLTEAAPAEEGEEGSLAEEVPTEHVSPTEPANSPTVSSNYEEEPTMLVDEETRLKLPLLAERMQVKQELAEAKHEMEDVKRELEKEEKMECAPVVSPKGESKDFSSEGSYSSSESH